MYNISKIAFETILKEKFSALVGVSCKRIEVLRDRKDISVKEKFNLLRDLIKELDYEAMRELQVQVKCFSQGLDYFKVTLNKPTSKK